MLIIMLLQALLYMNTVACTERTTIPNSLAELCIDSIEHQLLLHQTLVLTTVLVNSSINVMLSPAVPYLHHVTLYLRWLLVQSNIETCSISVLWEATIGHILHYLR